MRSHGDHFPIFSELAFLLLSVQAISTPSSVKYFLIKILIILRNELVVATAYHYTLFLIINFNKINEKVKNS